MRKATVKVSQERMMEIIRRPLVTEKTTVLGQFNQYAFEVAANSTKPEIAEAVHKLFKVDVVSVNVMNAKGKKKVFRGRHGTRSDVRKALVTLKQGHTIDVSVGV